MACGKCNKKAKGLKARIDAVKSSREDTPDLTPALSPRQQRIAARAKRIKERDIRIAKRNKRIERRKLKSNDS